MGSIRNSTKVRGKKPSFMRRWAACSLGVGILILVLPGTAFALESVKFAIEELCGLMMGNLGALLMTTAGVGALVAAAMGNFRASYSLLVVGIGAFTISAMLSLYFPKAANMCDDQGNTPPPRQTNRTINTRVLSDADIAVAAGRHADFSKAATLDAGDEGEEVETGDIFDTDFGELGADF